MVSFVKVGQEWYPPPSPIPIGPTMGNNPKLSQPELEWEPRVGGPFLNGGGAYKRWAQSSQGPCSLTKRKASQWLERMKPLCTEQQ